MKMKRKEIFFILSILFLVLLACDISFDGFGGPSEAEQTLQAIYAKDTLEAQAAQQQAEEEPVPVVFEEPDHSMTPGNPGSPDQVKDDIDTSATAASKHALGDSFQLGNLERPFTEGNMDYHPETDLIEISLSEGSDYYYFTIEVYGPGKDTGFPSAAYGIEFDTDIDGRGDFLVWVQAVDSEDWTIENVQVLEDSNEDVGGSQPVKPDGKTGDGYDRVLFSWLSPDDPDGAFQRVVGSDKIELAVKTGYIDNPRFVWKAWADAGIVDPAMFDYNDVYSESQAGSPIKNSEYYPLGKLNLVDSICWVNFGFDLTGNLLGGCTVSVPPTSEPPPPPPPLTCPPGCWIIGDHCECIK